MKTHNTIQGRMVRSPARLSPIYKNAFGARGLEPAFSLGQILDKSKRERPQRRSIARTLIPWRATSILAFLLALAGIQVQAAARVLPFQGRLSDASGNAVPD